MKMEIKNFRAIHDKEFIDELIAEGEHECQDFKFQISDSRKIARSIAAFANSKGGRLLVGVKDNGNVAGIRSEEEFYMIEQAAEMYCRPSQQVQQTLYCVEGKFVLKADIRKSSCPVSAPDDSLRWQVYYRVGDENIQVPGIVVRTWKARRRKGRLVCFSEAESRLLAVVAECEAVSVDELVRSARISAKSVEDVVVRLCALGVLEFVYRQGRWLVALAESDDFSAGLYG